MKRRFSAQRLDVRAFADEGGELSGSSRLREFPRLAAEAKGDAGDRPVEWAVRGELQNPGHVHPQVWIHLRGNTLLPLTCQRCLEPVEVPVRIERSFRFVADEQTAAAEDDESEEDLLAMSHAFDLLELLEDELLMELPAVPRHEVCPEPLQLSAADPGFDDAALPESPFARLKVLKSAKS